MRRIEADSGTLMNQAPATVRLYIREVASDLDEQFGAGYAMKNPALVGQLVAACAADLHTASTLAGLETLADAIETVADALTSVATALEPIVECREEPEPTSG